MYNKIINHSLFIFVSVCCSTIGTAVENGLLYFILLLDFLNSILFFYLLVLNKGFPLFILFLLINKQADLK